MPAVACSQGVAAGAHALEPIEALCKGGVARPQALAVEGEGDEGVELVVVGKQAVKPGAMLGVHLCEAVLSRSVIACTTYRKTVQ